MISVRKEGVILKKILQYICKILMFMVASAIIGINVYQFNAKFVLNEPLAKMNGYAVVNIVSGSMEPTFTVNDLLIIKEQDNYNVGDIITFTEGKALITHRIVEIESDRIITKGDNNNTEDSAITPDKIQGKAIKIIPGAGKILSALQNPFVFMAIILIVVGVLKLSYSIEKKKERERLNKLREELKKIQESKES